MQLGCFDSCIYVYVCVYIRARVLFLFLIFFHSCYSCWPLQTGLCAHLCFGPWRPTRVVVALPPPPSPRAARVGALIAVRALANIIIIIIVVFKLYVVVRLEFCAYVCVSHTWLTGFNSWGGGRGGSFLQVSAGPIDVRRGGRMSKVDILAGVGSIALGFFNFCKVCTQIHVKL